MASPELKVMIDALRAAPIPLNVSVAEMRAGLEASFGAGALPPGTLHETLSVNGVPAEWLAAPESAAGRVVLYLHGGGYVLGSIRSHRELAARIAAASGARALIIDYRLAPEHPFPAGLHDAVSAYRWLLESGVEPARLAIAGDSAGGGLTVATLLALRDAGLPLPATAVCISPWVDLEGIGDSMTSRASADPIVQKAALVSLAGMYLNGADPRTPLAAPLYAELAGLPPLLVQVGTAETLFDDSIRLAARARAANVEVELEEWPDMIHVWHAFARLLPEGRDAIERIGAWLRKRLA